MINHTLMLVYLIVSTIGLGYIATIHSSAWGINLLLKLLFSFSAMVGCVLTFQFTGLI